MLRWIMLTGSQYDTRLTLALFFPAVAGIPVLEIAIARGHPLTAAGGWHGPRCGLSLPPQNSDDIVKGLFDINAILGRSLNEFTPELTRQSVALLRRYFTLRHSIALVANEHNRDGR